MEGTKPKSCDVFVKKLLQRLARFAFHSSSLEKPKMENICISFSCMCSSKEDSLKDMQGLAGQLFSKNKSAEETQNAEADNRKKQQNKEHNSNSNLSPLARFLLSRFMEVIIFPVNNFIQSSSVVLVMNGALFPSLASEIKSMTLSFPPFIHILWQLNMLVNNLWFFV